MPQKATKRNRNPQLTATLTYPAKGTYANVARAQVTLPHSAFLDQSHIKTICTRVQFAAPPVRGLNPALANDCAKKPKRSK